MTIVLAVLGVSIVVSVTVWLWRKHRGVAIGEAAEAIVALLRGLFGG